jgi:hypothetical protein
MKKSLKMMKMLIACLLTLSSLKAQLISPYVFGQNAWMPDTIGKASACVDPPCLLNGKLHKKWNEVAESGARIVRFGGITPDKNRPTDYQYIKMIDSVRAKGMEPVMQVPFSNWRYTAQQAADIVYYVNVTRSRNVKYWIIGNEPDLGYSFTSSSQISSYVKPFSSAMKAVDPTIKIIGPECAWYNQGIVNGLTTPNGPDDITGMSPSGNYYIDYISFHFYPFNGSQTRSQVITKLSSPGSFHDNLVLLNQRLANCNSVHNRTGNNALRSAVTECNVNWQNSTSDNLNGNGVNSFIGGQFVAEMMGIAMKQQVSLLNIWSVIEGNSVVSNIGYLDPTTSKRKPLFYHFKLLADNFSGSFVNGVSSSSLVKTFGCKNQSQICVLVMNQDLTNGMNFSIALNSTPISGTAVLKLNLDAGITAPVFSEFIPAQSTILLRFDSYGNPIEKISYSLNDHAINNLPPSVYTYAITTGINSNQQTSSDTIEPFSIKNVYPVPTTDGKITVKIGRGSLNKEEKLMVQLFNLLGQETFSEKLFFRGGTEEIDLGSQLSAGVYILRIKEGIKENYLTQKIMVVRSP